MQNIRNPFFIIHLTLLYCLLTCSLLVPESIASTSVASVIALRGKVQVVSSKGALRQLKIKDKLFSKDTIVTGSNGRLQVLFSDNTIISLGKKSILSINDYILNEDKTGHLNTKVTQGVFRVMGGILTKNSPDNFTTETPSGNIGIRGSMYAGHVSGKKVSVLFEGGKGITLTNDTGVVSISTPGYGTNTSGMDQPISTPFPFSQNDLNSINQELSVSRSSFNNSQPAQRLQANPSFSQSDMVSTTSENEPNFQTEQTQTQDITEDQPPLEEPLDTPESPEQEGSFFALSSQVRNNQESAAQIFRNAVTKQGMTLDSALGAVLMGMQNSTRTSFDSVMNEAIDLGVTPEQAKGIAELLRTSGVCK